MCSIRFVGVHTLRPVLQFLRSFEGLGPTGRTLSQLAGWRWEGIGRQKDDWVLLVEQWRSLLDRPIPDLSQLNRRWVAPGLEFEWHKVWKFLWIGWGLPRARLITWRIVQHGYYTNSRGAKWGAMANVCPWCRLPCESIKHLFFECLEIQIRSAKIEALVYFSSLQHMIQPTLIETIHHALRRQRWCPAQVIFLTELFHICWVERNQAAR